MALRPLQSGNQPIGTFDGYDAFSDGSVPFPAWRGGEVCQFSYVNLGSDRAAKDADGSDGYVGAVTHTRPCVTHYLSPRVRPVFLADEGTRWYGTLFGQQIGGTAGQVVTGTLLGPNTTAGSGKVTIWDKPGLYAITLDAFMPDISNPVTSIMTGGDALYATIIGFMTGTPAWSVDPTLVVGRFVEYATNGSLVTTPNYLVNALNSPSGSAGVRTTFTEAVIEWNPE